MTGQENIASFLHNPQDEIHLAIISCKLKELEKLLEHGTLCTGDGYNCFYLAFKTHRWMMLEKLLQIKPEGVNIRFPDGEPLLLAASFTKIPFLLKLGANPHVTSRKYGNIITRCVKNGVSMEMVQDLIDRDIDLEVKDKYGNSCLLYAIDKNTHISVSYLNAFLLNGANPNIRDGNKRTALIRLLSHCSLHFNKTILLKKVMSLIKFGANCDECDRFNRMSALMLACYHNLEVVRLLLHTNLKHQDKDGSTVIMHAVQSKCKDTSTIVNKLLEIYDPEDIAIKNNFNKTALTLLSENEYWYRQKPKVVIDIANKLIKNGCDVLIEDDDHCIALCYTMKEMSLNKEGINLSTAIQLAQLLCSSISTKHNFNLNCIKDMHPQFNLLRIIQCGIIECNHKLIEDVLKLPFIDYSMTILNQLPFLNHPYLLDHKYSTPLLDAAHLYEFDTVATLLYAVLKSELLVQFTQPIQLINFHAMSNYDFSILTYFAGNSMITEFYGPVIFSSICTCLTMLFEHGFRIDHQNKNIISPVTLLLGFDFFVEKDKIIQLIAELVMIHGADIGQQVLKFTNPDWQNNILSDAVWLAAVTGKEECVKIFLHYWNAPAICILPYVVPQSENCCWYEELICSQRQPFMSNLYELSIVLNTFGPFPQNSDKNSLIYKSNCLQKIIWKKAAQSNYHEVADSMNKATTLQDLCRFVIRSCLPSGISLPEKIHQLPLPMAVKTYLTFNTEPYKKLDKNGAFTTNSFNAAPT